MPVLTHSTGEGEGWWLYTVNAPTTWCFSFGCWLVCREGAPASEGIAVEEPKRWCPICNQPDNDNAQCRRDYPTQEQLIELLRTIYAEDTTPERIKRMIEEVFRP